MKIDIKPKEIPTEGIRKIAMELYDHKKTFTFLTKKEEEFTVVFDDVEDSEKSIHKFCINRTVSEMKKAWEDGFDNQIKLYENAIKKKEHPYWTHFDKKLQCTVKDSLTKEQIKYFNSEINRIKENLQGELTFVAYVN